MQLARIKSLSRSLTKALQLSLDMYRIRALAGVLGKTI